MGLFDRFWKRRQPEAVIDDQLRALAPELFPGGHAEIASAGRSIAAFLDNRIPPDAAGRLYASAKYMLHIRRASEDRLAEYLVRSSMGRISADEARAIHERYLKHSPAPTAPHTDREEDSAILIDVDDTNLYSLENQSCELRFDGPILSALLLSLRSIGWQGASQLFSRDDPRMLSLDGQRSVSSEEVADLGRVVSRVLLKPELDQATRDHLDSLKILCESGGFTVSQVPTKNEFIGFRWSLYIVRDGKKLIYAMHENSVMRVIGYTMGYFAGGAQPVVPWSLYLNFNQAQKTIRLQPHHFTTDGENVTRALMAEIEAIDPGWRVEGAEPIFEEVATNRRLRISNSTLGQNGLEAMLRDIDKPPQTSFHSVMDEVFGKS